MLDFPASPTNGQSFAAPNGVTYTYQTPPGRWNDAGGSDDTNPGYTVTLEDYGGVGNGVAGTDSVPATGTDNTQALKDALAYLASIGGGTLRLGPKRYMIDLPGNANVTANLSNIHIQGVPGQSVLDFTRTNGFYNGGAGMDLVVRPHGFIQTTGSKHNGTTVDAGIMLTNDTLVRVGSVGRITAGTRSGSTITITTETVHGLIVGNLVWILGDPDVTAEDDDLSGVGIENQQKCFYTVSERSVGRTIPVAVTSMPTTTSFTFTYGGSLTGMDTAMDLTATAYAFHASDVIAVPSTALFARGERVLVGSLRERGRDNEHCNIGEYQIIGKILNPTLLRFQASVRESYAVADGARVFKLTEIPFTTFAGVTFVGKGHNIATLNSAGATQRGDVCLNLCYMHDLVVRDCTFIGCDLESVHMLYASKATFEGNTIIQDLRDAGGSDSGRIDVQYGFNFGCAVDDIIFKDNSVYGGRHAFVQGGSSTDTDFGVARNARFVDNYCAGQWLEAISTHQGADTLIYAHNYITGARGGINPRYAKNVIVTGNIIDAYFNGIILYNDVINALITDNIIDAGAQPIWIKSVDNPTAANVGTGGKLSGPVPSGPSIQISGNQIRGGRKAIDVNDPTPGLLIKGIEITDNSFHRSAEEAVRITVGNPNTITQPVSGGTYSNTTGATVLQLTGAMSAILDANSEFTLSGMAGTGGFAALNGTYTAIAPTGATISYTDSAGLGTITFTGGTVTIPGPTVIAIKTNSTYDTETGVVTLMLADGTTGITAGMAITVAATGTGAIASINGAQTATALTGTIVSFIDAPGNGATTISGGTLTMGIGGWTGTISNNRFYDCCVAGDTYQLRISNAKGVRVNDNLFLGTSAFAYAFLVEGDGSTGCEFMGNTVAPTLYTTQLFSSAMVGTGHKTDMTKREDIQVIGGVAAMRFVTTEHLRLRMESGSADDLDSITGGGLDQQLKVSTQLTNWIITAKDNTGNIQTFGNYDRVLNNSADKLSLMWNGTAWIETGYLSADGDSDGLMQNIQAGNYTTTLFDAGKHLYHAVGAAVATWTIPANATVPYQIGTTLTFINDSANAVTIAITTDTLVLSPGTTTGSRTLAQGGIATAAKVTATRWVINGSGLT